MSLSHRTTACSERPDKPANFNYLKPLRWSVDFGSEHLVAEKKTQENVTRERFVTKRIGLSREIEKAGHKTRPFLSEVDVENTGEVRDRRDIEIKI